MAGNRSPKHINSAATTQAISLNAGAILGTVEVNKLAGVASTLTIFDAATAGDCTAANTIAAIDCNRSGVGPLEYNAVASRGLMYTLSAGTPDITVTFG